MAKGLDGIEERDAESFQDLLQWLRGQFDGSMETINGITQILDNKRPNAYTESWSHAIDAYANIINKVRTGIRDVTTDCVEKLTEKNMYINDPIQARLLEQIQRAATDLDSGTEYRGCQMEGTQVMTDEEVLDISDKLSRYADEIYDIFREFETKAEEINQTAVSNEMSSIYVGVFHIIESIYSELADNLEILETKNQREDENYEQRESSMRSMANDRAESMKNDLSIGMTNAMDEWLNGF